MILVYDLYIIVLVYWRLNNVEYNKFVKDIILSWKIFIRK